MVAARVDLLEAGIQLPDAAPDQATVRLQLGFTRPAQPDTAFLPLEMRPAADQPGRQMPELGEFNLQLAFETACSLREDIQNQAGAVEHAALELPLEVAFLAR